MVDTSSQFPPAKHADIATSYGSSATATLPGNHPKFSEQYRGHINNIHQQLYSVTTYFKYPSTETHDMEIMEFHKRSPEIQTILDAMHALTSRQINKAFKKAKHKFQSSDEQSNFIFVWPDLLDQKFNRHWDKWFDIDQSEDGNLIFDNYCLQCVLTELDKELQARIMAARGNWSKFPKGKQLLDVDLSL